MESRNFKENTIDATIIASMMSDAGFTDPITDVTKISAGMLNVVYKVSLKGRTESLILRVRLFKNLEYGQEFAAERFSYYLTQGAAINFPQLHYVCTDDQKYGYPFAVFDCIEGPMLDITLSDPITTKKERFSLLGSLANSLNEIHKVKGPGFGTLTSIWFSSEERRNFWSKLFYAEHERLLKLDDDLGNLFGKSVNYWLDCLVNLPPFLGDPRLVHGDIHGRNVIVTNKNEISLIDWEASRFRIVPYDFAQIRYLNLKNDNESWEFFIKTYISSSSQGIDEKQFREAIDICEAFWHLRMGLFQLQFPSTQDSYFGYAEDHLRCAVEFMRK